MRVFGVTVGLWLVAASASAIDCFNRSGPYRLDGRCDPVPLILGDVIHQGADHLEGRAIPDCNSAGDYLQFDLATVAWTCASGGGGVGDITAVGDCTSGACFTVAGTGTAQVFKNATSGQVTLQTVTGALGTRVVSLPAETGTVQLGPLSSDVVTTIAGVATIQADSVALGTDTTGGYAASVSEGGPATTATALAANGANCAAGEFPLGVDASGAVESCTTVASLTGRWDQLTAPVTNPASFVSNATTELFNVDFQTAGDYGTCLVCITTSTGNLTGSPTALYVAPHDANVLPFAALASTGDGVRVSATGVLARVSGGQIKATHADAGASIPTGDGAFGVGDGVQPFTYRAGVTTYYSAFGDSTGNATGVVCTGCVTSSDVGSDLDASDLGATITLADADFLDMAAINASSTTEGLKLPQATSVTSSTAEGQITWDTDDDTLYGGTGSAVVALSGGELRSVQVFTADGTWTRPAGITRVRVVVVGGGGGGGGVSGGSAQAAGAAGGGAGGYSEEWLTAPGTSETVTVGAGGAGGSAGNNAGSDGGTSSFGSGPYLQATGGVGGAGQAAGTLVAASAAGAGGVGSSGDVNAQGGAGENGQRLSGTSARGGFGGGSMLGGGGIGTIPNGSGVAGGAYGGGGSGACDISNTGRAGGDGASGLVAVYEYR